MIPYKVTVTGSIADESTTASYSMEFAEYTDQCEASAHLTEIKHTLEAAGLRCEYITPHALQMCTRRGIIKYSIKKV